jgi:IS30 family transposase
LKLKSGLKNTSQVKSRTNSRCLLKNGLSCVQSLFINIFGKIKKRKNLYLSLRTTGKRYRKEEVLRGVLSNRRLIEDRPKIVDLKQRFGDLEIDTIIGKNHKVPLTINDRATGILRMKIIKAKVNWLNKRQLNY